MKSHFTFFRSFGVALLFAGALSSAASAQLLNGELTKFTPAEVPSGNAPVPAYDWVDGIANVSSITAHGTVTKTVASAGYSGFGLGGLENYVGFSLTAEAGQSIFVDNITHGIGSSTAAAHRMASFYFGYRIDADGAGAGSFGDWVLTEPVVFGDPDFAGQTTSTRTWDIGISTTGSIEFGVFGVQNASGGGRMTLMASSNSLTVNGSVAAVPEPSTYGMILAAGLAALILGRRRKAAVND